jgi:hypothetical protein
MICRSFFQSEELIVGFVFSTVYPYRTVTKDTMLSFPQKAVSVMTTGIAGGHDLMGGAKDQTVDNIQNTLFP